MKREKALEYLGGLDPGTEVYVFPAKVYWFITKDLVGDCGKVLLSRLMGVDIPNGSDRKHPRTDEDVGECLMLLREFPELRKKLPMMADVSLQWAAISRHWDEIEECYYATRNRVRDKIEEVIANG